MVEPINLNKARKARERVAAEAQAQVNRVRFGRTKAERDAASTEQARAERCLDDRKRTPDD